MTLDAQDVADYRTLMSRAQRNTLEQARSQVSRRGLPRPDAAADWTAPDYAQEGASGPEAMVAGELQRLVAHDAARWPVGAPTGDPAPLDASHPVVAGFQLMRPAALEEARAAVAREAAGAMAMEGDEDDIDMEALMQKHLHSLPKAAAKKEFMAIREAMGAMAVRSKTLEGRVAEEMEGPLLERKQALSASVKTLGGLDEGELKLHVFGHLESMEIAALTHRIGSLQRSINGVKMRGAILQTQYGA